MKFYLTMLIVVVSLISISAASDIPKKPFQLNERIEKEIGYAQAVRIGDTLYISDSVGAGEVPSAIRESYDELKKNFGCARAGFSERGERKCFHKRSGCVQSIFTGYLSPALVFEFSSATPVG